MSELKSLKEYEIFAVSSEWITGLYAVNLQDKLERLNLEDFLEVIQCLFIRQCLGSLSEYH